MDKVLTIIRGLPGSGKSTTAKALSSMLNIKYFEADMFFMKEGLYSFDSSKLTDAHNWCKKSVENCMSLGVSVIVSNTFTKQWEVQPYIDMAKKYGYKINLIECKGYFDSVHDVPTETIIKMKSRWQEINLEDVK